MNITKNFTLEEFTFSQIATRKNLIKAEAEGQSWLKRNWRPLTMITFLVLVVCDSFEPLSFHLSNEAWLLLQIGLGGYVVGRSGEKIVDKKYKLN